MSDDPKAKPGQRAPAPPASEDRLLTSEDLFGDMLDLPADAPEPGPPAPPPTAAPSRTGPIKVQVGEPGTARKARPGENQPGEELPDDIAALLDAFEGPAAEEAPRPAPPSPPAAPAPQPPKASPPAPRAPATQPRNARAELPNAADFGGVDDIFDALLTSEASPAPAHPRAAPTPPPPAPPPPQPVPEPAPVTLETLEPEMELSLEELPDVTPEADDLALESLDDVPALQPIPESEKTPVTSAPDPEATMRPTSATEILKEIAARREKQDDPFAALLKSLPARKEKEGAAKDADLLDDLPAPTSRTGTKFGAAAPRAAEPDLGGGLDLAALADEALGGAPAAPAPAPAAKPEAAPPKPADARRQEGFGPYLLLEKIAVGGMAEVFRAKRTGVEGFEKVVAVKRILPHLADNKEFVDMFIDEAKMVAGLTHPNIVQIFDLGRLDKSYYIAMEYVHGRDLRTILRRGRDRGLKMPLDLAVLIAARVASALEYAHRARDAAGRPMRIVHRDISPQNILISFEGDVKLTDFGIAKAATKASNTDRGALRGKLLYMSPEQAWGKPMDRRSDLYSLGILFYEMLTEQKPFLSNPEMSVLETVREGKVAPPSSVNPKVHDRLERIVMKALEKEPDHRYQDAAEMFRDLERVLHERQPPAAAALARYIELLFDADERGAVPEPVEGRTGTGAGDIEMDFDHTLPGASTSAAPPKAAATPARGKTDASSIQSLLKRFGIK